MGPDYAGIALVITAVGVVITATTGVGTMLLAWRTHGVVVTSAENIQKVETATNSMKDALVKATGEKEHAAGVEFGRQEARKEAKEDKVL